LNDQNARAHFERALECSVLECSLQVVSGISAAKEQALWLAGIRSWDELERSIAPQISLLEEDLLASPGPIQELFTCRKALAKRDVDFFAGRLDRSEHFRIALSFPEDCLFLDIETTGLSRYYDQITVIGWRLRGVHGFHC